MAFSAHLDLGLLIPPSGKGTHVYGWQYSPSSTVGPSHGAGHSSLLKRTYLGLQAQRACETSFVLGGGVKWSKVSPPLELIACSGCKMQLQDHCRQLLRTGRLASIFFPLSYNLCTDIIQHVYKNFLVLVFVLFSFVILIRQRGFSAYPHTC